MKALTLVALLTLSYDQAPAASACIPSATDLVGTAIRLRAAIADNNDFIRAFDAAFGLNSGALMWQQVHMVERSDGVTLGWSLPFPQLREDLLDALRKRQPVDAIQARTTSTVYVLPTTINAQNIERIIVERDGQEVPPIASRLKATTMSTALGATVTVNAGEVVFPCSAFAPGGRVRVIAIGAVGNITKDFTEAELTTYSPTLKVER